MFLSFLISLYKIMLEKKPTHTHLSKSNNTVFVKVMNKNSYCFYSMIIKMKLIESFGKSITCTLKTAIRQRFTCFITARISIYSRGLSY